MFATAIESVPLDRKKEGLYLRTRSHRPWLTKQTEIPMQIF